MKKKKLMKFKEIEEIELLEEKEYEVFNLECEPNHTYIANSVVVHNCQPLENDFRITEKVLLLLKSYNYPVIFSTKGKLILDKRYYDIIKDYENFALQISLIDDREEVIKVLCPNGMTVAESLKAFEMYKNKWTACRIQPFIIGLSEERIIPLLDKLQKVGCNHIMVEGLKFFSGNPMANKRISNAFKIITGEEYDLLAYYKSTGAKFSGNDIELPSWRKWRYIKIFNKEVRKRGMTFGCADNDLRHYGDSPCCCGIDKLKGFEGTLKHNTGTAIFRAKERKLISFNRNIIENEWMPEGKFRNVLSVAKLKKRYGREATYETANRPIKEMFNKAWEKGNKNSPCDVCCVRNLGCGHYRFLTEEEEKKVLKDRGTQKRLF